MARAVTPPPPPAATTSRSFTGSSCPDRSAGPRLRLGLDRAALAAALALTAARRRLAAVLAVGDLAVAVRDRAGACRLRLAHGGLERVRLVGALPVEIGIRAPEVTVVGGLLIDRPQQVQLLD